MQLSVQGVGGDQVRGVEQVVAGLWVRAQPGSIAGGVVPHQVDHPEHPPLREGVPQLLLQRQVPLVYLVLEVGAQLLLQLDGLLVAQLLQHLGRHDAGVQLEVVSDGVGGVRDPSLLHRGEVDGVVVAVLGQPQARLPVLQLTQTAHQVGLHGDAVHWDGGLGFHDEVALPPHGDPLSRVPGVLEVVRPGPVHLERYASVRIEFFQDFLRSSPRNMRQLVPGEHRSGVLHWVVGGEVDVSGCEEGMQSEGQLSAGLAVVELELQTF